MRPTSRLERLARNQGFSLVAGVDEVGRGCLFGPVYAAAVILSAERPIRGLRDSKQLSPEVRETLAPRIRDRAVAFSVAWAEPSEIDAINIYQASRLAMKRAVERLSPHPDYLLIDALTLDLPLPQKGIIKGDTLSMSIAAASILAKVERDACMRHYDQQYPGYGLASHKGYPSKEHLEALARLGPTPLHRRSFEPVRVAAGYGQMPLFALDLDD